MNATTRFALFFYGNGNLWGCAAALLGPALMLAGVIGAGWLFITAGLYGAGFLLAPKAAQLEAQLVQSLSQEQTLDKLDEVVRSARVHLSTDMALHLDSIRASVTDMLPRLASASGADETLFTVRETVFSYLPRTLASYMALPPAFRATHPVGQGKTARELLGEQLRILDDKMQELLTNLASRDAQALLANGQFLQARFQQPEFLVR